MAEMSLPARKLLLPWLALLQAVACSNGSASRTEADAATPPDTTSRADGPASEPADAREVASPADAANAADATAGDDAPARADVPAAPEVKRDTAAALPDTLAAGGDGRPIADLGGEVGADATAPPDLGRDGFSDRDALPDLGAEVGDTQAGQLGDSREAGPLGKVTVVADGVLSSNATALESYDTNVNVASYRQHGLLSYQGFQFVAWFNGNTRNAIVARRTLDPATLQGGTWAWAYVDFVLSSDGDSHNVMSMGISPGDGRLHVAIGQHGSQLYSIRTTANATTGATWDNTVFGGSGTTSTGAAKPVTGLPGYTAPTHEVTYPYFVNAPDGTLQFAYRTGSSGDGELQLAEYGSTGNWSHVGQVTSATGTFTQNGVSSMTRNAYPHGLDYDGAGRLHMTFTWRENLSVAFLANCADTINNHDTLYVYSDDRGRTWKNNGGTTVTDVRAGTSAGVASAGLVIDRLPVGRDLMNQETQLADHAARPHAVVSYVPERYQATCATDRSQAQPFHLWRAPDGTWSKTEIRLGGQDVNQGYDRGKLFVDASDNAYLLLPDLRLLGATAITQWTDWQMLWDGRSRANYGEAIIDRALAQATGNLSVLYLKDTSATTGELHVLDVKLALP